MHVKAGYLGYHQLNNRLEYETTNLVSLTRLDELPCCLSYFCCQLRSSRYGAPARVHNLESSVKNEPLVSNDCLYHRTQLNIQNERHEHMAKRVTVSGICMS